MPFPYRKKRKCQEQGQEQSEETLSSDHKILAGQERNKENEGERSLGFGNNVQDVEIMAKHIATFLLDNKIQVYYQSHPRTTAKRPKRKQK